jgi:hypothetical protein
MNKFWVLISLLMISQSVFSSNIPETTYHCPSINDIKYEQGSFYAVTNYNKVNMRWYTLQTYPEATVSIEKFKFTNSWNDRLGGTSEIYCVYEVNSGNDLLKLSVSRQEYRFLQAQSGPWKDGTCKSDNPEDCTFTVVRGSW